MSQQDQLREGLDPVDQQLDVDVLELYLQVVGLQEGVAVLQRVHTICYTIGESIRI